MHYSGGGSVRRGLPVQGVPASGAGYRPRLLVQQREEVGLVLTGVWFGSEIVGAP